MEVELNSSELNMEKKREKKMSRPFCINVKTESGKMNLKKTVEQIIKQNQKVFDKLAKS